MRYAPPSPKNIWAFGKLNLIKTKITTLIQNKIKLRSFAPDVKLINNNIINIINECIPNNPLKPSIRLDPFIINKKHKQIKNNEKISICNKSKLFGIRVVDDLRTQISNNFSSK